MPLHLRKIESILTVVERTLRKEFPDDFHKRCAYAAQGTIALLTKAGAPCNLVGGDFVAFVMSPDTKQPGMQGFGGGAEYSHYWIESEGRLIDLGTHFLPNESSYPIVRMPAVAWDTSHKLPNYLRYRPLIRAAEGIIFPDPDIKARMERFIAACEQRMSDQSGPANFPTWLATSPSSVAIAANKGDLWAVGASKFETWVDPSKLPF